MNIEEACKEILGEELASRIIKEQGTPWAILAACAAAHKDHNIMALSVIACCVDKQGENVRRALGGVRLQ